MEVSNDIRKCIGCKQYKKTTEYSSSMLRSRSYLCKPCDALRRAVYYRKNKLKEAASAKKYNKSYPNATRLLHYKRLYKLTLDGYNEILIKQDGKCAICLNFETHIDAKTGKVTILSVDHDHGTGKVRGLLCRKCNSGLGMFKDDIRYLNSAIKYLDNPL